MLRSNSLTCKNNHEQMATILYSDDNSYTLISVIKNIIKMKRKNINVNFFSFSM